MRCALARVFILLSIALALANAQCFTRCLVKAPDHATPPCHSQGKTQVLPPQHDIRPSAVPTVPLSALAANAEAIASPFFATTELRPPRLTITTTAPLPLRI
jgi:hypothetical protein